MTAKALTFSDVFPSTEAAKQAVKKYIVGQEESYKLVKTRDLGACLP